jgi:hypothetical protein
MKLKNRAIHKRIFQQKKKKMFLDPIYETLFSGHTGRPIRSIGTQIDKVTTKLKKIWPLWNFWAF